MEIIGIESLSDEQKKVMYKVNSEHIKCVGLEHGDQMQIHKILVKGYN